MSSSSMQSAPKKVVIVACPVSSGEVRHVAGVGVLMAIRFIEKSEQYETGEHSGLQFLLDPEQALEIGEALQKSVQTLELGKALKKSLRKSLRKPANKPAMLLPATSCENEPALAEAVNA